MPAAAWAEIGGLQRVIGTTFRRRMGPSVDGDVRSFKRIALAATNGVRRKEPLHALEGSGRCAVALIPCYDIRSISRGAPSQFGYP